MSILRFIVADVKCYHCGHVSGQLRLEDQRPWNYARFLPADAPETETAVSPGLLRCGRCGGPVFLDELERVQERASDPINPLAEDGRRRRHKQHSPHAARAA